MVLQMHLQVLQKLIPIVGAITGIIKADGAGNILRAVAGTDYLVTETITLATLKTEVAASTDFADSQPKNSGIIRIKIWQTEYLPS